MLKGSILMLCALLLLLASSSELDAAKSPVDTGAFTISGSGQIATYDSELFGSQYVRNTRVTTLALSISGFVYQGLAVGCQFSTLVIEQVSSSYYTYAIGPRITYYLRHHPAGQKASGEALPYVELSYQYSDVGGEILRSGSSGNIVSSFSWLHSFRLGGGVTFMATEEIGISTDLNYQRDIFRFYRTKESPERNVPGYGINLSLGLAYFIW